MNDVTICSPSPILWTVYRSIILASDPPFSALTYGCRSGAQRGSGAFPQVEKGA